MSYGMLIALTLSHETWNIFFMFQISVNAEQVRIELEPPDKTKSLGTIQQTRRQKMQQK